MHAKLKRLDVKIMTPLFDFIKGQLNSKYPFGVIIWTKITTAFLEAYQKSHFLAETDHVTTHLGFLYKASL